MVKFNWEIYKELNKDLVGVLKTRSDYEKHFKLYGKAEDRKWCVYQEYPNFDYINYRDNYEDLMYMKKEELERHWILHGRYENRIYEKIEITETMYSKIDKILFINLENRLDRRNEITEQFLINNVPNDKVIRIEAIYDKIGALGCTKSHIKGVEYAIENNLNNVLILEDDYNFIKNRGVIINSLNYLINLKMDWDVILFSGNALKTKEYDNILNRAIDVQTTSGYLVNKNYFKKLLENYKNGCELLEKTGDLKKYSIDIYWKKLQIDNWYIFKNKLGYQRQSYSNILNNMVNYQC